jgi:AcrR family transcriptional regulator
MQSNKKNEIINSTLTLLSSKSFNELTIDEIAKSASIGKGTIYSYFKTKEEILKSAYSLFIKRLDDEIINLLNQDGNQLLDTFLNIIFSEKILNQFHLIIEFWIASLKGKNKIHFFSLFNKSYQQLHNILSKLLTRASLKKGFDKSTAASIIIAASDGLILQNYFFKQKVDIKKFTKTIKIMLS